MGMATLPSGPIVHQGNQRCVPLPEVTAWKGSVRRPSSLPACLTARPGVEGCRGPALPEDPAAGGPPPQLPPPPSSKPGSLASGKCKVVGGGPSNRRPSIKVSWCLHFTFFISWLSLLPVRRSEIYGGAVGGTEGSAAWRRSQAHLRLCLLAGHVGVGREAAQPTVSAHPLGLSRASGLTLQARVGLGQTQGC